MCYKFVQLEHLAAVWGEGGGPEEPCLVRRTGHDGTCVPGKRVNMGEWGQRDLKQPIKKIPDY